MIQHVIRSVDENIAWLSNAYNVSPQSIASANGFSYSMSSIYEWLSSNGGTRQAKANVPTGYHWSFTPGMVVNVPTSRASLSPVIDVDVVIPAGPGVDPGNPPIAPDGPPAPSEPPPPAPGESEPPMSKQAAVGGGLTMWLLLGVAAYFFLGGGGKSKGKPRKKSAKRSTKRSTRKTSRRRRRR